MNNIAKLKRSAITYLSKYSTSKKNLKKILHNKIYKINLEKKEKIILYDSVNDILAELESKKFINDINYSELKIRNLAKQGKSRYFIYSYLVQKGIEKHLIDEVFFNFEIENPNWEIESAKIFIAKKKLGLESKNNKKNDLAKMARAGFDYSLSKKILKID